MIRIKGLLVTVLVTVLVAANFSAIAYASDTDAAGQPLQDNLTDEDDLDDGSGQQESHESPSDTTILNNGEIETSALTDTDIDIGTDTGIDKNMDPAGNGSAGQETADITNESVMLEDPSLTDEVPEGYEIYIDEQGQVYYLEIEPEEEIIEESGEDSTDEVSEPEDIIEPAKSTYSEKDLRLLACLIYAEAGNQSYNGMLAVANVVLNRAKSDVYSHVNTIEEVIYDKKWNVQFSVTIKSSKTGLSLMDKALKSYDTGEFSGSNPEAEKKAMDKATKAAKAALQGKNNIGDYLCFRVNNKYASSIKKKYSDYKIIGDHIFYRTK